MNDTLSTTSTFDVLPYRDRLLDACEVIDCRAEFSFLGLEGFAARFETAATILALATSGETISTGQMFGLSADGPVDVITDMYSAHIQHRRATDADRCPSVGALVEAFQSEVARSASAVLLDCGDSAVAWGNLTARFAKATEHLFASDAK